MRPYLTSPKFRIQNLTTYSVGIQTQSGAIFISRAAEEIIKHKLGGSKFSAPEYVAAMVEGFDTKTKILFDNPTESHLIKFGFDRDTDKVVGISRGRLTLTGCVFRASPGNSFD